MSLPVSGKQSFQIGSGCFLVIAVLGWSGGRTERLFEKRDADALGATHFFQGGRRPRLALHHLRKQGQPDGDDLAFLGQAGHGLFRNSFCSLLCFAGVLWQFAEGTPKGRQHLPGVIHVEEIDRRRVLAFKKSNLQLPHEAASPPSRNHPAP